MDLSCQFKIGLVIKESIKAKLGLLKEEGKKEEEGERIREEEKEESKKNIDLKRAIMSVRGNLSKIMLK